MHDSDPFQQALGLQEPWSVVGVNFDGEARRLELVLDFAKGARFACPECKRSDCTVHDTEQKAWRHLDFFQHQAFLTARVPRVRCPEHGVHLVKVAWARPGSGFTLLFEALTMALCQQMPIRAVAGLVGEHDTRVWRIVHHYVDEALARQDLWGVERVGVDDTSFRRGQSYVTLFADLDKHRCVIATPGRDAATIERFAQDLRTHGGHPDQVTEVCQDMSEAYLLGVLEQLQEAGITFDRYHVKAQLNAAVDEVRKAERLEHGETLKRSRYLWLKRPANLNEKQRGRLDGLLKLSLKTGRAYNWALRFELVYELDSQQAGPYLRRWIAGAVRSRLQPLIDFAHMVEDHWPGVLRGFESHISNGLLEGLNSLVQSAKRRARGYRSTRNYIAMIYLTVGKLDMALPT